MPKGKGYKKGPKATLMPIKGKPKNKMKTLEQAVAKDRPKGPGSVPKSSPRAKSARARLKARKR